MDSLGWQVTMTGVGLVVYAWFLDLGRSERQRERARREKFTNPMALVPVYRWGGRVLVGIGLVIVLVQSVLSPMVHTL